MTTTYRLTADDLNASIIQSIKSAFKGKTIDIIVSDTDEIRYADLMKRVRNLKKNKNTVVFSQEKFFKTYRKKVADASN